MQIREATDSDWPEIWPIFAAIVAAGDTYAYDQDMAPAQAHALWMLPPPGHTFVAVDNSGSVLGTAKMHRNQTGPGSHVATASFMVDPARAGGGVGRALGEHVLATARAEGYLAMQFNAVVETITRAVALWRSLGFEVLATIPRAFRHPTEGYVGLHVMHQAL